MARRTRLAAVLTLAMINVFTLAAGITVARMLPPRLAALKVPTVAAEPGQHGRPGARPGTRRRRTADRERAAVGPGRPAVRLALGPRVAAVVTDPATGKVLWSQNPDQLATPASTTKLVTSAAALAALGPDATFTTKVVRAPRRTSIILVGGGDPTLAVHPFPGQDYPRPATLASLAAATAASAQGRGPHARSASTTTPPCTPARPSPPAGRRLRQHRRRHPDQPLEVDQGRLTTGGEPGGLRRPVQPAAAPDHRPGRRGRRRVRRPAHQPTASTSPAPRRAGSARRTPPPSPACPRRRCRRSSQQMLEESNNVIAENLARHVALAAGKPASFSGAAARGDHRAAAPRRQHRHRTWWTAAACPRRTGSPRPPWSRCSSWPRPTEAPAAAGRPAGGRVSPARCPPGRAFSPASAAPPWARSGPRPATWAR